VVPERPANRIDRAAIQGKLAGHAANSVSAKELSAHDEE
jgi:hypothetical protein